VILKEMDVVGYGEAAIDFIIRTEAITKFDDKVWARSYVRQLGGVTANFCVGLSRLGRKTAFMGAVGDDPDGEEIRRGLEREGVDTGALITIPGRGSSVNYIVTEEGGSRLILQSPNMTETQLRPDDITEDSIPRCRVFHTSAIIPDTAVKAAAISKEKGAVISFDLERHVAEMGNKRIEPLLKLTDILFTGAESLEPLGFGSDEESFHRLLSQGPKVILLKKGKEGVTMLTSEQQVVVGSYKVDVVDATGAGDAFAAGFISGFLDGASWIEAAAYGNAVAAIKCTKAGAQAGLPTRQEVDDFVSSHSEA
jgi:sugar/nucleoside kinase (ribokinase family)